MHRASHGRLVKAALVLTVLALAASASSAWCADMPSNPEKYLGMPWLPEGVSTYAKDIDALWDFIFYLTGAVFIITEGLLIVFLIKYRKREGAKSIYTHGNHTLEMIWTITPAIILGAIAIMQKKAWDDIKKPENFPKGNDVVHIQTFAKQFEWNFRYAGTDGKWGTDDDITLTNRLVVPVDHPIVMEQTSLDVIHSFFLPNMRLKQDVVPGMQIRVWFEPMKTTQEMRQTRGDYVKPVELMSDEEKQKPTDEERKKRVPALLTDLVTAKSDDKDEEEKRKVVRGKAEKDLKSMGDLAIPFLKDAVASGKNAEVYDAILKQFDKDKERAAKLLADLGADNFEFREAAEKSLAGMTSIAGAQIKDAAANSADADVRQRCERILKGVEPWTYEVVCAELCGMQHGEMRGTMDVLEEKDYDAWLAKASEDAGTFDQPDIWNFWPVVPNSETGERDFAKVKAKYHEAKEKEKAEREKNKGKEE